MDFDPDQYQHEIDQRRELLEEVAGSEIAFQTLKAVCASKAPGDEALEADILTLYETADDIEQETLGSGSGQEGRQAVTSLVTRKGEALFDSLIADDREKEGDADA